MTESQKSEGIDDLDAIVAHLRMLVSKERRGDTSLVRKGFDEIAGKKMFTPPQMRAVFSHASETGKTEINGTVAQMWPFFHDGLSKITMACEALKAQQRVNPLFDAIIISRWNAVNFPKILDFDAPKDVPSYPVAMKDLSDFRLVPAYIEQSVMPHLKSALAAHLGTDINALDKMVAEREAQLVRDGIPGYEALRPIEDWPQGKRKSPPQTTGGPEAKPL